MKKRIMYITQASGGVAKYLKMLFKYINKDKYEQILVYPNEYINEKKDFEGLVDKIEFIDIYREISVKNDVKSALQLYKVVKKYNPDLIYLQSSKAGALGRIINIAFQKPIMYNPHGWAFNMDISNKKKYIYILIERLLAKMCDKIVAISNEEKKSAIKNRVCSEGKIEVIFNGIDLDEYESSIKNNIYYKETLNIPKDSIVIGMVGRISRQKAPDVFVKAASKIKEKFPNAFFIIVGDGDEHEKLDVLIEELGLKRSILITGWVGDVYKYIKIFDIAMLLSRWEGFGLAIAEYMISRIPVIATNVDAIPNLIINNETGILVEVDNIEAVVEAVSNLIHNENLINYIVKNAEEKVKKDFDIKRVALEHEVLINKIIS